MPFSRVLLVLDPAADAEVLLRTAQRVAPGATHVHWVALVAPGSHGDAVEPLERARQRHFERCYDVAQLGAIASREQVELVVVGPWPTVSARTRALALVELSSTHGFDVLVVGDRCPGPPRGDVVGLSFDAETTALGPATAAVRALPGVRRVVALVRSASVEQLEATEPRLRALLPELELECAAVPSHLPTLAEDLEREAAARDLGLLVVDTDELWRVQRLVVGLAGAEALAHAERPLLLLRQGVSAPLLAARLSASDTWRVPGQALAVQLERTTDLGRRTLDPGETFLLVGAEARGPLRHEAGRVCVPEAWLPEGATSFALVSTAEPAQVVAAQVIDARRVALFASDVPATAWPDLEAFAIEHALVAVRLRADEPLEVARRRLDEGVPWGGPVPLVDASAFLDDGGAGDVPQSVDALRVLRCAHRLLCEGVPVAAVVTAGESPLESGVVQTWTPETLRRRSPTAALGRHTPAPASEAARWDLLTGSTPVRGHRVQLELDNGAARRRLLASIAAARSRVHWQCYIVEDDGTAAEVSDALAAAAARGVTVRVLVDSLYSLHEVYGAKNPVLARLAEVPGVEVRGASPVSGVPSLELLKARNHRKLVVVDGREATVTGRNLADVYYRGFDEQALTDETPFPAVPWLDASALVEGPLVEAVEYGFLTDWARCGGAPFDVEPLPPAGGLTCRFISHEGLRDAHTFDALLEFVRGARRSLVLVNTFPLVIELQRALLAALARGVEVTVLFGNVRPRWGDGVHFSGGVYRELGDELVRARLEPVLRAGARGYEFVLPSASLGRVLPHVHAKLYLRDDERLLVGTANLDVTSAYWESEVLLAVEDAAFAREARAALEPLLATSRLVDLEDPAWAQAAARRAWLGENWPNIVG
jgi:phosphatidylserine/phosphatidylglycerophosphate/cardiolipin synthase-like enzyme